MKVTGRIPIISVMKRNGSERVCGSFKVSLKLELLQGKPVSKCCSQRMPGHLKMEMKANKSFLACVQLTSKYFVRF